RALVQRAVDKAEQLGLRGAVAVVGASGTLLTASRMDAGGPGGMARARAKAWISARSEKRRVGEEGRSRWSPDHLKKKKTSTETEPLHAAAGWRDCLESMNQKCP